MNVELPNSAFLGNIDGTFFRKFDPSNPNELHISLHPQWISVHPVVLAMTAALGLLVPQTKITCDPVRARSGHYLKRMGLFNFLCVESGITIEEHESAGRFIPLTQIKNSEQLSLFLKEMVPLLHLDPKQAESIWYIISELVRNVIEHAQTKQGAIVAAQYFKKSNKISIGIVDTGIGIRASLGQSYKTANDLEAIRLALMPGVTGTTTKEGGTEQNAGAGLFFIKSIAKVNHDFFVVYSGKAMYKLLRPTSGRISTFADPFKDKHSAQNNLPFWQGTVVGIDLSLDATPVFSTLLENIRETYFKAVKERRRERYRKPKFI